MDESSIQMLCPYFFIWCNSVLSYYFKNDTPQNWPLQRNKYQGNWLYLFTFLVQIILFTDVTLRLAVIVTCQQVVLFYYLWVIIKSISHFEYRLYKYYANTGDSCYLKYMLAFLQITWKCTIFSLTKCGYKLTLEFLYLCSTFVLQKWPCQVQ